MDIKGLPPAAPIATSRLDSLPAAPGLGGTLYVSNAGLVLAGAYLTRLFARLSLLDGKAYKDPAAALRVVQLCICRPPATTRCPSRR